MKRGLPNKVSMKARSRSKGPPASVIKSPSVTAKLPAVKSVAGGKAPQKATKSMPAATKAGGNSFNTFGGFRKPGKKPL